MHPLYPLYIRRSPLYSSHKKSEFLLSPHLETASQIKKKLIVSSEVEIVNYNSLSKSEPKIRRVFDARIKDSIV